MAIDPDLDRAASDLAHRLVIRILVGIISAKLSPDDPRDYVSRMEMTVLEQIRGTPQSPSLPLEQIESIRRAVESHLQDIFDNIDFGD